MKKFNVYATYNAPAPINPVIFNEQICNGCNKCVEICQMDVYIPNPEKRKPPIILHPDECYYCGSCVDECSRTGAVKLNHPLMQRIRWKRKQSGEHFRL